MVNLMKKSKHGNKRCQQRGFTDELNELLFTRGKEEYRPGGAMRYSIDGRTKNELISEAKKFIHLVERAASKSIIISTDNTLITAYPRTK